MKLAIQRSQQDVKGMLGGHKGVTFTLSYRLILSSEEQELVNRYKLDEYPVTWHTFQGERMPDDTIGNMMGRTESDSFGRDDPREEREHREGRV